MTTLAAGLLGLAFASSLSVFLAGIRYGRRRELERWTKVKLRAAKRNERAIAEAKLLYEFGEIDEAQLETRVGHLHDWDGNP